MRLLEKNNEANQNLAYGEYFHSRQKVDTSRVRVFCFGEFDGATAKLQVRSSGDCPWMDLSDETNFTENGQTGIGNFSQPQVRGFIEGGTGDTSITMDIV